MMMATREPDHYLGDGEVTCSRALASMCAGWDRGDVARESEVAYWFCSALKYIWRWNLKGDPESNIRKAVDCAQRALAAWTGEEPAKAHGDVYVVDGRTAAEIEADADEFPLAVFATIEEATDYLDGLVDGGGEGIVVQVPVGERHE